MLGDGQWGGVLPRIRADHAGAFLPGSARSAGAALVVAVALALLAGCSGNNVVHPALQVQDQDVQRASQRGANLIAAGECPDDAFAFRIVDVNERASPEVIVRSAGIALPADRLAYEIAKAGDSSDAGVRRAISQGQKAVRQELMCVASIELPQTRDPASVEFALKTSAGVEYPPIAVETPVLVRGVYRTYDPTAAPSELYYYVVHFPVRGGPGVRPIGPEVNTLTFAVRDAGGEVSVPFTLPRVEQ
jgi:hypothetical protein